MVGCILTEVVIFIVFAGLMVAGWKGDIVNFTLV